MVIELGEKLAHRAAAQAEHGAVVADIHHLMLIGRQRLRQILRDPGCRIGRGKNRPFIRAEPEHGAATPPRSGMAGADRQGASRHRLERRGEMDRRGAHAHDPAKGVFREMGEIAGMEGLAMSQRGKLGARRS